MIPKIIHFCWLSNDPYPEKIQKCIDSWHKFLPDYEFVHWNFDRFPRGKSIWVDQAFDNHKYAFAADYIRLYALYNYGGIYLDTDVEVLKSFDDLLSLPYFIGRENSPHGIEAAIMGAEKNLEWIKDCFDYYEGRKFVIGFGDFDTQVLPRILLNQINKNHSLNLISNKEEFAYDDKLVNIFPIDWFSPKKWDTGELVITQNTRAIHHFAGTWKSCKNKKEAFRRLIRNIRKIIGL